MNSSTDESVLRIPSIIQGVWDNVREYLLYLPMRKTCSFYRSVILFERFTSDVDWFVLSGNCTTALSIEICLEISKKFKLIKCSNLENNDVVHFSKSSKVKFRSTERTDCRVKPSLMFDF